MPYFKLKGKPILPNNSECPVEVVPQNVTCESDPFFNTSTSDSSGRVILNGVTDAGYKLITANSSTSLDSLKNQDAFGGRLKIKNVNQKYCYKGLAPLGSLLNEYSPGTYYFYRKANGYCEIQDENGTSLNVLSTAEEKKKIYTFILCGGGGSGCSGGSGMGWWGGGGGSGAGAAVFTLEFTDLATASGENLKLKIVVGAGGSASSPSGKSGSNGGQTSLTPDTAHFSFGTDVLAYANGGSGNPKKSSVSGGSAFVDSKRENNSFYKVISSKTATGGSGGGEASSGGGTDSVSLYNYSVNSNYISSIGNKSGGGKSGGGNGGGGGGASLFADGNSGSNGAGGHGGEGAFGSGKSSQAGGDGFIRIYY